MNPFEWPVVRKTVKSKDSQPLNKPEQSSPDAPGLGGWVCQRVLHRIDDNDGYSSVFGLLQKHFQGPGGILSVCNGAAAIGRTRGFYLQHSPIIESVLKVTTEQPSNVDFRNNNKPFLRQNLKDALSAFLEIVTHEPLGKAIAHASTVPPLRLRPYWVDLHTTSSNARGAV